MERKYSQSFKAISAFSEKCDIINTWTNILWLRRFDLCFIQTSKGIYRKLQYTEKVFGKFQRLPRFTKKMVLYSSSKFCNSESFINSQLHKNSDWDFCQISEQVYRISDMKRKFSQSFKASTFFPEKWFCICWPNLAL